MSLKELCQRWLGRPHLDRIARPQTPRPRPPQFKVEQLEDRHLPSSYTAATVSDLIADIKAANKHGGANTITLVAGNSFSLSAVDNTAYGPTGLPAIATNDNPTIIGNGDTIARSTAAGTPAFRLFAVSGGGSLTLQNLTLQGGLTFGAAVAAQGGAIYSVGLLDLSGVTVQNNIAQGQTGESAAGGGIYSAGALTLEGGTLIQNNQAIGGRGGISVRLVGGAYGLPGGSAYGGGVYVAAGTVTITDVTLSSNSARGGQGGGGVNPWTFQRGGAGGNGLGGGIYVSAGSVTLTGASVSANAAVGGAGGLAIRPGSPGLGEGGGVFIDPAALVYLDAFTHDHTSGNSAASDPDIHGTWAGV